MKTIIFVCHGNICRSVAAEFIAKQYVKKHHLNNEFKIYSRATSLEEIGNDIYPPMKEALRKYNISFERHNTQRISKEDYDEADLIFYMDEENHYYLNKMFIDSKNKIKPITIYSQKLNEISDPWYNGKYEEVVEQLICCINVIFKNL